MYQKKSFLCLLVIANYAFQGAMCCTPNLFNGCFSWLGGKDQDRCNIPPPAPHEGRACKKATQPDYYYDSISGKCVNAPWSSCMPRGQGAGFKTEDECRLTCALRSDVNKMVEAAKTENVVTDEFKSSNPDCNLPREPGIPGTTVTCFAAIPSFYYDTKIGKCSMFIFGGCGGNSNRFASQEDCEATCLHKQEVKKQIKSSNSSCNEPSDRGLCLAHLPSFYYDMETGRCSEFFYGGCSGNTNRFATIEECESSCDVAKGDRIVNRIKSTNPDCNFFSESGIPGTNISCMAYVPSFYYDMKTGKCSSFIFGGCGGNSNRFPTKEECESKCINNDIESLAIKLVDVSVTNNPICKLPKVVGRCKASFRRYYYDAEVGRCIEFIYGGCNGNDNNFKSIEECEKVCRKSL